MYQAINACRVCGNSRLEPILDLGMQALTGVFPRDEDEDVPLGPLRLLKCYGADACGLVQLAETFSATEMYGDNYGYRSGLNPSMVEHLHSKVATILSTSGVPDGAVVLDIGSNDGTTLSAYPSDRYQLIGIDPTASKFRGYYPPDVQVIEDFFSEATVRAALGDQKASVVTSFSMFYDLDNPLAFMEDVRDVMTPDGVWVFEQSYLPLMLEANSYDTVCHEHIEYYSLTQIVWMTERVGLEVIDVEFNDVNGGSFSVTAAKSGSSHAQSPRVQETLDREVAIGLDGLDVYMDFARRVADRRQSLLDFIAGAHRAGESVGALGASTKGNVLLQYCGLTPDDLIAVGEINEEKIGRFTPGTRIPICSEAELLEREPDYLLVLPWHFRKTFINKSLKGDSRLVFPLPNLEVVGGL